MNLIERQVSNEFKSVHHLTSHVTDDLIKSSYGDLADKYEAIVREHVLGTDYSYEVKGETRIWETKEERHTLLMEMDLKELAWKLIANVTVQPTSTLTSLVGMCRGYFGGTIRQQAEQASECIMLVGALGLISFELPKHSDTGMIMVHSKVKYDGNLDEYLTNTRHVMPSLLKPKKVTNNKETGYTTFKQSLILAGKHHDKKVPYDHINRMNSVALSIDPMALSLEPVFEEKAGESTEDREERYGNWKQFNVECMGVYAELFNAGNKFYITHRFDERLRSYANAYHATTQGDAFRKSVIELANKEVVNGTF